MNIYEEVSRDLRSSFFKYNTTQPEIFQIILHPINIHFIWEEAKNAIQNDFDLVSFMDVSVPFLNSILSEPYRQNTLSNVIDDINKKWIQAFKIRYNANVGISNAYIDAVKHSFVPQPSKIPLPVVTNIRGEKILEIPSQF